MRYCRIGFSGCFCFNTRSGSWCEAPGRQASASGRAFTAFIAIFELASALVLAHKHPSLARSAFGAWCSAPALTDSPPALRAAFTAFGAMLDVLNGYSLYFNAFISIMINQNIRLVHPGAMSRLARPPLVMT